MIAIISTSISTDHEITVYVYMYLSLFSLKIIPVVLHRQLTQLENEVG